jgi:hypothetical protein
MGAPVGNQNAVKEHRRWSEVLNRAIAQDDGKRLRDAAEKLLDKAADGEPWAIKEIGDRLDGKAAQSVTVAGDANAPLQTELTVKLVKADGR